MGDAICDGIFSGFEAVLVGVAPWNAKKCVYLWYSFRA